MRDNKKYFQFNLEIPKKMTSTEARQEMINSIYRLSCIFFETIGEGGMLTDNKRLFGNGHHMAQNVAEKAVKLWDEMLEEKEKIK